jgi:hypothetical protein
MSNQPHKDKAEDQKPITKTTEYRRFHKLLKQVIKSPPMKRSPAHKVKKVT